MKMFKNFLTILIVNVGIIVEIIVGINLAINYRHEMFIGEEENVAEREYPTTRIHPATYGCSALG